MRFVCLAFLLMISSAHAVPLNHRPVFAPLYSAYSEAQNDNFYTTNLLELNQAVSQYGYVDTGIVAYVEKRQQPNTLALMRYYKGPPQTDHFYTTDVDEGSLVQSWGWVLEGNEGYIYTTLVPGSVPLYRVSKANAQNQDLVHKFTRSWVEVQQLQSVGWVYDNVAGYVYATEMPPAANGWIAGFRCPHEYDEALGCWGEAPPPADYRDFFFPDLLVDSTPRPANKRLQQMQFEFWSPDFFSDGGHLAFGLHGQMHKYLPDVSNLCLHASPSKDCTWHRGLGFVIYGQGRPVFNGSQVGGESFWVMGNAVEAPRQIYGTLSNNRRYRITASVDDSAYLSYTIVDLQTNTLVVNSTWGASRGFPYSDPFPANHTGFFMVTAGENTKDFTFYVTNLHVSWWP